MSEQDEKRAVKVAGRFARARLCALALGFAASLSTAVYVLTAVALLLAGKGDITGQIPAALAGFAAIVCPMAALVSWADRRLISELRKMYGPELCESLLIQMQGLFLGRSRAPFEAEFARLLGSVQDEWWRRQSSVWNQEVRSVVKWARTPNSARRLNRPWLPALLDAIARCERTELLSDVEKLETAAASGSLPPALEEVAMRCAQSLRACKALDARSAGLLRPAAAREATLMRPAGQSSHRNTPLLRPAGLSEAEGESAVSRAAQSTGEHSQPVTLIP